MLNTSDRIKKQIKNVESAERALKGEIIELVALQNMLSREIKAEHPIASFLNKQYFRFRTKWGNFDDDYVTGRLDDSSIKDFDHLEAYSIKDGNDLNAFVGATIFDGNKNYVIYVEYYYDFFDDFNEVEKQIDITPYEQREIYEYLIFEI